MAETDDPRAVTPGRRAPEPQARQDLQVDELCGHPGKLLRARVPDLEVSISQAMSGPMDSPTAAGTRRRARRRGGFRSPELILWAVALGLAPGCTGDRPGTA